MTWLLRAACGLLMAGALLSPQVSPALGKGKGRMEPKPPFELRLELTSGPGLRATLVNLSSTPQAVLHHDALQPSRVILIDAAGGEARPFDERTREKSDATLYRSLYVALAPRARQELYAESFRRTEEGTYELWWGPYHYEGLKPGEYRARVEWKSQADRWYDEATGKQGQMTGIWKGTVASPEVKVRLP